MIKTISAWISTIVLIAFSYSASAATLSISTIEVGGKYTLSGSTISAVNPQYVISGSISNFTDDLDNTNSSVAGFSSFSITPTGTRTIDNVWTINTNDGKHSYQLDLNFVSLANITDGSDSGGLYKFVDFGATGYITDTVTSEKTGLVSFTFTQTFRPITKDGETTWSGVGGNITVSAVPIPAAGWLFGSAILGLAGLAKRRKTATA